jgi:predicted PurR-regulated permease PerM
MDRTPRSGTQSSTVEGLIAAMAVAAILYFGRAVFVPLALAILLSFVLNPAAMLLRRLWFGRVAAALTVIFLAAFLVLGLGAVVTQQVSGLAASLPRYEDALSQKIKGLESAGWLSRVFGPASETLQHLGREIQGQGSGNGQAAPPAGANKPVPVEVRQPEWQRWGWYRSIMETLSEPLSTAAIVAVFLVFIMLQRDDLRDRLIRLMGTGNVQQSTAALNDAGERLSRYFVTQTIVNSLFGCFIGLGLAAVGVPNAVLFGAIAGLMRFVPFIGSFIAAAIPLVLAVAIEPGWTAFFLTLGLYAVGESFVGQVVEPLAYGHTTGLSPFAVIVSASFWTWLWGPPGLVMAVPLTVCLVVLATHTKRLEFLYILLTDAPALTPQQSFYQRMLAANGADAERDAERYLKAHSLSQFYAEVAIPGLALAYRDWERGALTKERLAEIAEAAADLVADLDDYDDIEPAAEAGQTGGPERPIPPVLDPAQLAPGWQKPEVLAIGGRTAIDAAAAAMLAQLLRKHGVSANTPPLTDAGRAIFRTGLPPAPLICVSYFGAATARAHVRALTRRLGQLQPEAQILLCCWDTPAPDAGIAGPAVPAVASVNGALSHVLELARSRTEPVRRDPSPEKEVEATH